MHKKLGRSIGSTTKLAVAPVGDLSHSFSESQYAVKYPPEVAKEKSKGVIEAFGLPANTPMKLRLIAPCTAYDEKTKKYIPGELIITRKNIAFLSDSAPKAIKRIEIKSTEEGKKSKDPQLKINASSGNTLKLKEMTDVDKNRAIKIIGHLIKQKDKSASKRSVIASGFSKLRGKKKKKRRETRGSG